MSFTYFIRNKNLANTILLPYLFLCLTMGGFHDGIFTAKHCNHAQQSVDHHTIGDLQIGVLENIYQHNSETCQICQWLKTPSTLVQFLLLDTSSDCVCNSFVYYFDPIIPCLSIHKFTIRPPPSFSCFPT